MKIKTLTLVFFTVLIFSKSADVSAQMFWNQACSFAGTGSSYISCRNTSTTNITGNFTLEAWVNPNNLSGHQGIIVKGSPLGITYAMKIITGGRIEVITNTASRLFSKTTSTIPLNQWTHIAATFHFNTFAIYINGAFDTSANVGPGASPVSTGDSLFMGSYRTSFPFSGMMDEVRIWNRDLSSLEIFRNMRLTLGTNSGHHYSGLTLSMTFQKENSAGVQFTANDWSGNGNYGTKVNVSQVNLSDQPSKTILLNRSLYFFNSGVNDYLAGADNAAISPTTGITLQAWVYPLSTLDRTIIHKGAANGATTNYSLNIIGQKLAAKINGVIFDSRDTLPIDRWSHVAFTWYSVGAFTYYNFYVNGKRVRGQFFFGTSTITDGTDSLYIGGTNIIPTFRGFIDEVRISKYSKPVGEINDSLYTSMENGFVTDGRTVGYNFDGYTYCNSLIGPFLYFRNFAEFSNNRIITSPIDKGYSLNFQKGFYMKTSDRRIPETGFGGPMMDDTLDILLNENITDINVYVAISHGDISGMQINLIAPDGTSVQLINSNTLASSFTDITTVFDDQASTPLVNNTYVSFSPAIRPLNNLNSGFNGVNTKGKWRLAVNDNTSSTGRLYAWGLRFNNKSSLPKILSCTSLIQGFYNSSSNTMIRDTMRCYVRNTYAPYAIVDSSKVKLQSNGSGIFTFTSLNILKTINYFFQLKHRNSIETWSNGNGAFDVNTSQTTYDFTTDSTKAFGNNLIQVDNSPVEFAVYNGDVNQDGTIDLSDVQSIDNAVLNFESGYLSTDVNGDGFIDLNDLTIADNNASNFVSKITP